MADYLDRDKVLDLIASCRLEDLQGWDYEDINAEQTEAVRAAILWAVERMDAEDTADVVEVVRCWNCVWWDNWPASTMVPTFHRCKRVGRMVTEANDFCSRGERNDG